MDPITREPNAGRPGRNPACRSEAKPFAARIITGLEGGLGGEAPLKLTLDTVSKKEEDPSDFITL